MSSEATQSNREVRESQMKTGVILTVVPFLSIFVLGPLSQLFPVPSPWPIRGFIGMALIGGMISGPLGIQRINQGRAGKYDKLGIAGLALVVGGVGLFLLFLSVALVLVAKVFLAMRFPV